MITIVANGLSHIGRKRRSNQDRYLLDDSHRLYVVADGMGGHQAGEVASQLVVDAMQQFYTAQPKQVDRSSGPNSDPALSPEANSMREAIAYANQQVYQAAADNRAFHGMGSTVAAVHFAPRTFIAANVGDSPIYLVHEQSIETLSVPHTLLAERPGLGTDDQAHLSADLQHLLTRGMGVDETVMPDICESPWYPGDRLVLCSDGLSGKVSPDTIRDVVTSHPAAEACQILVDMANENGGDDNITVVLISINQQNKLLQKISQWVTRFKGGGLPEA
jgi:protein phosphatase